MDGAIMTVVHDEFRGMRLGDMREFMYEGGIIKFRQNSRDFVENVFIS
jgi:hypothetical protein